MANKEEELNRAFNDAFDCAEEATLSAYRASRCNSIADFMECHIAAEIIVLANSISATAPEVRSFLQAMQPQIKWGRNGLFFTLSTFRTVSHEPGFWDMLCSCIPTCTTFVAANANSLSDSEIRGFCTALGSYECTFRTLMLHGQEYGGAEMNEDNDESIRQYLWPALLRNTSVKSLSIVTRFGTGHNLFSTLSVSRLRSLTLYITPENIRFAELHLKEVFNGLAHNTISLTSLCIHSLCTHRISAPEEFGKMLSTNTSLTSLRLCNCHVPTNVFRELFCSLATNRHLQNLSLAQCDGAWPNTVVLDSLQTNSVFHELDLRGTPLKYNAAIFAQLARNSKNAELEELLSIPSLSEEDILPRIESEEDIQSAYYSRVESDSDFVSTLARWSEEDILESEEDILESEEDCAYYYTQPVESDSDFVSGIPSLSLESDSDFVSGIARLSEPVEGTVASTVHTHSDEVNTQSTVKPTAVRLFLCGLPYSGKTTLSRSFVAYKSRMVLMNRFSRVPERTRGIEITTLEEDDLKVSLWDLAGQSEYYTFHNYMFPNLSSRATPAFFLFVWNPIEVDQRGHHKRDDNGALVEKSIEKFEEEFKYWLRFIASKTLRSEKFKPRVIIVITRKDCNLRHMKGWTHSTLLSLQDTFGDIIQFDMNGIFEIDARVPMELKGLAKYFFDCARDILDSAPKVHAACKDARSMIATLVDNNSIAPLITRDEFSSLCKEHLCINSEKVQEAIALSLNDSGDVIYFASLQFVVVDTQWFCHQVMGDLMSKSIRTQSSGNRNPQGIFSVKYLEDLLEAQVNSAAKGSKFSRIRQAFKAQAKVTQSKVGGEDLVKLLVELQLACRLNEDEGNLNVFIPASLSQKNCSYAPHFSLKQEGIKAFLGRRLKCKDSKRTFLTPTVFPIIQVVFYSTIKTANKRKSAVTLEEDLISYAQEGNGVIIELFKQQGEEHFIDILVCSHLELAHTIKWVHKNVITIIERVCAEPKGMQGVELKHEVIRPECVQCIDRIEKRTQSVSVTDLRERLEKHLREEGFGADGFNNVLHTWIPGGNSHRVDELLGEEVTLEIVETYWQGLSVAAADALGVVPKEQQAAGIENLPEQQAGRQHVRGIEEISDKLDEVLLEVKNNGMKIDELRKEMQNHGKKIDELRKAVIPKLEDLFTFFKEGEAKLPRMLVVSKGQSGLVIKVATAKVPKLSSWRLELLCECESGPHSVKGYPGIDIATLEDGLLKRGLPYINTFLKVANVALKVGAHVALGLGNVVPDFLHVLALIEDTNEFPGLPTISDPADPLGTTSFASRENFQEGQQWLLQVLSSRNYLSDIKIKEVFGLTRIRYPSHKIAWVCKEHTHKGQLCPL